MRRFRFPHQSILNLKGQQKREAMLAVAAARQELSACEQEIETALASLETETKKLTSPASAGSGGIDHSMAIVAGLSALRSHIDRLRINREKLAQKHSECCDRLAVITNEVRVFEQLRHDRFQEHRRAEQQRQQKVSDELAERRHRLLNLEAELETDDSSASAINNANRTDESDCKSKLQFSQKADGSES